MPFKSQKQERFLFKFHPDIARRWAEEYGSTPMKTSRRTQIKANLRKPKYGGPSGGRPTLASGKVGKARPLAGKRIYY